MSDHRPPAPHRTAGSPAYIIGDPHVTPSAEASWNIWDDKAPDGPKSGRTSIRFDDRAPYLAKVVGDFGDQRLPSRSTPSGKRCFVESIRISQMSCIAGVMSDRKAESRVSAPVISSFLISMVGMGISFIEAVYPDGQGGAPRAAD